MIWMTKAREKKENQENENDLQIKAGIGKAFLRQLLIRSQLLSEFQRTFQSIISSREKLGGGAESAIALSLKCYFDSLKAKAGGVLSLVTLEETQKEQASEVLSVFSGREMLRAISCHLLSSVNSPLFCLSRSVRDQNLEGVGIGSTFDESQASAQTVIGLQSKLDRQRKTHVRRFLDTQKLLNSCLQLKVCLPKRALSLRFPL